MKGYEIAEPEEGEAFRLYTITFNMAQAEEAEEDTGGKSTSAEEEPSAFCLLGSSTDSEAVSLNLGNTLTISTGRYCSYYDK